MTASLKTQIEEWDLNRRWFGSDYLSRVYAQVHKHVEKLSREIAEFSGTSGDLYALYFSPMEALAWHRHALLPTELISHPANIYFHKGSANQTLDYYLLKARVRRWNRTYSPIKWRVDVPMAEKSDWVILGLDPGVRNHGYTVAKITGTPKAISTYTVLESGMFKRTFNDFHTDPYLQAFGYAFDVQNLIIRYGVEKIVAERFLTRGFGGDQIEKIGVMLGAAQLAALMSKGYPAIKYIQAATWKNSMNKIVDLKSLYAKVDVEPHRFDAGMMAMFNYPCEQPFAWLKKKTNLDKVLREFNA